MILESFFSPRNGTDEDVPVAIHKQLILRLMALDIATRACMLYVILYC